MTRHVSTGAFAPALAKLLLSLSLMLTAMASTPQTIAFASTGGATELTVQRETNDKPASDGEKKDDGQTHATVTSGQEKSGGGSLAKTGDDTLLVPPAIIAAGACLSILGLATRTWASRRHPRHLKEDKSGLADEGATS